jgi:hypothetical protein
MQVRIFSTRFRSNPGDNFGTQCFLRVAFLLFFPMCLLSHLATGRTTSDANIEVAERAFVTAKVYSLLQTYPPQSDT